MDKFKATLEACELGDLGFIGDAFTWRNHSHTAVNYIKERIDRAVATQSWCNRFSAFKVTNGDPRHSDHRPIIIDTQGGAKRQQGATRSSTPRIEAKWLEEEDCRAMVENAWKKGVQLEGKGVAAAVKGVMGELVDWSRNILGDLEKRISKTKELEKCRRSSISAEQVRREELLRFKLGRLEDRRELYWRQRAHVH